MSSRGAKGWEGPRVAALLRRSSEIAAAMTRRCTKTPDRAKGSFPSSVDDPHRQYERAHEHQREAVRYRHAPPSGRCLRGRSVWALAVAHGVSICLGLRRRILAPPVPAGQPDRFGSLVPTPPCRAVPRHVQRRRSRRLQRRGRGEMYVRAWTLLRHIRPQLPQ